MTDGIKRQESLRETFHKQIKKDEVARAGSVVRYTVMQSHQHHPQRVLGGPLVTMCCTLFLRVIPRWDGGFWQPASETLTQQTSGTELGSNSQFRVARPEEDKKPTTCGADQRTVSNENGI